MSPRPPSIGEWGGARLDDLVALAAEALPDEDLTADDLELCCFGDLDRVEVAPSGSASGATGATTPVGVGSAGSPTTAAGEAGSAGLDDPMVVLGTGDGTGAVAVVLRPGEVPVGFVQLLAVAPGARRAGVGRALLDAAVDWSFGQGAGAVRVGGGAPFYLWPGVDVRWTAALCLAEAAGFVPRGAELNMACSTRFRAPPPSGCRVDRPLDEAGAAAALVMVGEHYPQWVPEVGRALEQGTCLAVVETASGRVTGVGCHSVSRAGWVGPMATDPAWRGAGVGSAALGAICADLMSAGYDTAEICWVGPVRFYASAGGAVSRVFRTLVRRR